MERGWKGVDTILGVTNGIGKRMLVVGIINKLARTNESAFVNKPKEERNVT